jgi:hypothetical protein
VPTICQRLAAVSASTAHQSDDRYFVAGARLRQTICDHWREQHEAAGYEPLCTPHLGKAALWCGVRCALQPVVLTGMSLCDVCSCHEILRAQRTRVGTRPATLPSMRTPCSGRSRCRVGERKQTNRRPPRPLTNHASPNSRDRAVVRGSGGDDEVQATSAGAGAEEASGGGGGPTDSYQLKPMNCPFHCAIYASRPRAARELPLRWGELGTVYRYEPTGTLHGGCAAAGTAAALAAPPAHFD